MQLTDLLDEIIILEGGFVDHPNDPGGATKYGISLRYARAIGLDLNNDGVVDREDILLVDKKIAQELFLRDFFYGPKIDMLPEEVWPVVFDMAINSGPRKSVEILQDVANIWTTLVVTGEPLTPDGRIGPMTAKTVSRIIDEVGPTLFINSVCEGRKLFYEQLVLERPASEPFLDGWLNRAEKFKV